MRAIASCHFFALILSTATVAFAQTPSAESDPAPQPAAAPVAPAASAAAPVAQPPAPPAIPVQTAPGSCSLGSHGGVADSDAITMSQVVCAEVNRIAGSSRASYVVEFQRLGNVGILGLAEVDANGRVVDRRTLRLSNIEEVFPAAPRLADALIGKKSMEQTQQVDNIVGEEARVQRKKYGKTHFGLGVLGTAFPGGSAAVAPGLDLALYHETARAAIGGDLRMGTKDNREYDSTGGDKGSSGSFVALSVGGRYFTSLDDFTPFVGGGLSWSTIDVGKDHFKGDNSGFSAYAEVGVEVFRTHKSHLNLGLRATLPFYSARSEDRSYPVFDDDGSYSYAMEKGESKYVVPVTLNATVLF